MTDPKWRKVSRDVHSLTGLNRGVVICLFARFGQFWVDVWIGTELDETHSAASIDDAKRLGAEIARANGYVRITADKS